MSVGQLAKKAWKRLKEAYEAHEERQIDAELRRQDETDDRAEAAKERANQRRLRGMVRRTCRNCGHVWYIPKGLRKAGRSGAAAGLLSPEYRVAGAILGSSSLQMDTCADCGSVRFFDEERA